MPIGRKRADGRTTCRSVSLTAGMEGHRAGPLGACRRVAPLQANQAKGPWPQQVKRENLPRVRREACTPARCRSSRCGISREAP